jgi:diguanylate cyclase (GGDEF)-like protein
MREHVSLQAALDAMTEQIAILDGDRTIMAANAAWKADLRNDPAEPHDLVGRHVREAFPPAHGLSKSAADRILEGIDGVLQGRLHRFDFEYREARGARARWIVLIATPLGDGQRGALIARRDVTPQKAREADLLDRANNDGLTGLPNRSYFLLEAQHMLALARRQAWQPALVYLDLDNFKEVNDRYGHAVGDLVLGRVGVRLRRLTRESDLLARLGGDEFVILLNDVTVADSARIVNIYRRSLAQPPIIDGMPIIVQASFGVAHHPADGVTVDALLAVADRAMYAAKAASARRRRPRGSDAAGARSETRRLP